MNSDQSDSNVRIGQSTTSVSFTGLMTAVTTFFTGLLISTYGNYPETVRVPILFLIISTFGFLFSTLIYTNSIDLVNRSVSGKFRKFLLSGDVISEYLGVYLLVFAIPLVINIVISDTLIRAATDHGLVGDGGGSVNLEPAI